VKNSGTNRDTVDLWLCVRIVADSAAWSACIVKRPITAGANCRTSRSSEQLLRKLLHFRLIPV